MPTTTFVPNTNQTSVSWNDPARWSTGVVPNDPAIDVIIPLTTVVATGSPYISTITETGPIAVGSLAVTKNNLTINGALTVAHDFSADGVIRLMSAGSSMSVGSAANFLSGSEFDMNSGSTFSAGSLVNDGVFVTSGSINVSGAFLNEGVIHAGGLSISAASFSNQRQLVVSSGISQVSVAPGGFANLVGHTLTGADSQAFQVSGALYLNVGGIIDTNATYISLGANGAIYCFDDASQTYIPISSSLHTISDTGTLSLADQTFGWGDLTVDGSLMLSGANTTLNIAHLTVDGSVALGGSTVNSTQLTVNAEGHLEGVGSLGGPIVNDGVISAHGWFSGLPLLSITGPVTGSGILEIGPAVQISLPPRPFLPQTLELGAAASSDVIFRDNRGTLILDDPAHFTGGIAPSGNGDQIILKGISSSSVLSYSYSGDSIHGTLAIHTASGTTDLEFLGAFTTANFALSAGPQNISTDPASLRITKVDAPPVILSDGGGDTATVSVLENTTAVTVVTATDSDAGSTLTYSIVGGADRANFQIDSSTGALSFKAAPNFEAPTDSDHNNSYLVQVRATSGALSDDQIIAVHVTNVPEPPHWIASSDLGSHPPGWVPISTGDFNHDATADVLWFNPLTLGLDLWKIQNGKWSGSTDLGTHPAGYQPSLSGDFNNDGTADVLWYNPSNGDVDIWKIANGQWAGSVAVGPHPLGWQPAASGDFNGDGTSDILWFNPTTGNVDIWKLANGQWAGSANVGPHPIGYTPVGSGDFDHDGTSDVFWFNPATGDTDIWKIVDGHWAGSTTIGLHPAGWTPVGVSDFNQDGTSDVVWFNAATGNIDIWLVQNGHWSASVNLGNHPLGWAPAGIGDFDHNGSADILWREAATNRVEAWLLANS